MKKKLLILVALFMLIIPFNVSAGTRVTIYLFYGSGCSHCHNLMTYLDELEKDNTINYMFELKKYEVMSNIENRLKAYDVAEGFGSTFDGVPYYAIGDKDYSGYSVTESKEIIRNQIKRCYENNIKDYAYGYMFPKTTTTQYYPTSTTTTNTNSLTRTTTIKNNYGTTTKKDAYTSTTTIPSTEETSKTITPDKNGKMPQDIVDDFFNYLKNKDEKGLDLLVDDVFTDDEIELEEAKKKMLEETNADAILKDYKYVENEYFNGEFIEEGTFIYEASIEGTIAGFEIDLESDDKMYVHFVLVDGEYKISYMDYPVIIKLSDIMDVIGLITDELNKEFGGFGFLIIIFIILMIIVSFLPFIFFFIIIIAISKAIIKANRKKKEEIEQGIIPPNNRQGM